MLRSWHVSAILLLTIPLIPVCGCGGVKTEVIEVKAPSALDRAKTQLKSYADGQPMLSEASDFPNLVAEVKKTDPQKGEILEKGLAELTKPGVNLQEKAKELLGKL